MNSLKCAEQKIICNCIDVYRIHIDEDLNEDFKILSDLRKEQLNIKDILNDK